LAAATGWLSETRLSIDQDDSILLPWNYQLAHNPEYVAGFEAW
jgi:hypothetical protein